MDSKKWRDRGFPNVTEARHAIHDPKLRDLPAGNVQMGGQSMSLMNPDGLMRPTSELTMPHGTYGTDLAGDYVGGLVEPVPREILFPDWVARRRSGGGLVSDDNRSFALSQVRQPTNNEWQDQLMKYIEANQRR
jgi:hypothetical protein